MKTYAKLANIINYLNNASEDKYAQYPLMADTCSRYWQELEQIADNLNGSGFLDTHITDKSNGNKLEVTFSYHVMNEAGYYNGYLDCRIKVTPSLLHEFDVKISLVNGNRRHYNDLREYFYDIVNNWLESEVSR